MTEKEWLAYFQSQRIDQLQQYLQRGRAHAKLADEDLDKRWADEFKKWASNYSARIDHRPQEDLEAELHLRGREPPFNLVCVESSRP